MEMDDFLKSIEAREQAEKQALLDEIKLAQERIKNKDKAIEELKFERELIFGNFLNIINEKLRLSNFNIFMGFNDDMFWKAWRWNQHKSTVDAELEKGELTDEEYKTHKTCFDMTTRIVKDKFFGDLQDQVKFKEIIKSWSVGYDFIYKYKRQEITIFVPTFTADKDTWLHALSGYRAGYKESDCVNGYIASDLEYKEVAKKLQDWMLAEGWKKNVK